MTRDQLIDRIKGLAKQVYSAANITPEEALEYDELTKFPELKKVIVDLLTSDFDYFLASIDWVAPKPTTFRINLKNGTSFYLIFHPRSWIAQVEGKKYYLLNLNEEESATNAIARLLRIGAKVEPKEEETAETPAIETPAEEPAAEEEATPEPVA